jgi:H+-transporting ATPase
MSLVGLLLLADPLDEEAAEVINFMKANGIEVKMLTGDNRAISQRVTNELSMQGEVVEREKIKWTEESTALFQKTAAFAEILPDDKYRLVQAAKKNYVVAVTGDGINDLPPIKVADAGIAVSNALDALKGAADIVLLTPGLAVVKDAVIEARKIFARLYSYSVYRISESFRIILTVVVLGLLFLNYPLTPLQLILLALMNDIPIVSLAFNRVKIASRPAKINVKERFMLSTIFGLVGVANSLLMVFVLVYLLHMDWGSIQTVYFLKLTVSGHLLIYVAHTAERWFRFLPSREVILATMLTQLTASAFAAFGLFMTQIPVSLVALVWVWAFFWMQVSELGKYVQQHLTKTSP